MWIRVRIFNTVVIANFTNSQISREQDIQQTASELLSLIDMASETKKLLLSFKGVEFMSSAMIGKLVLLNKKAKSRGITLKFCDISPNVIEVFKITRLNKVFRMLSDKDLDDEEWRDVRDDDGDDDDDRSGNAGVFAKLSKHPSSGGAHAKPPNVEK